MPLFTYSSIDSNGKAVKGFMEAVTMSEAKERLRRQGIFLTSLKESKKESKLKLKSKDLLNFTSDLSNLVEASCPLYESLISLEENARKEKYHPILLSLADKVKRGSSLSEAMADFPDSFSSQYLALIGQGEAVGNLDRTLSRLHSMLSKQMKFQKQLINALLYPCLLVTFSFLVILLLLTFVVPSLEFLFEAREVNRFTKAVVGLSHFLREGWCVYLPFLALLGGALFTLFKKEKFRLYLHEISLKVPLLRKFIVERAMARFSRGLGGMLQGGVSLIKALGIARKLVGQPSIEKVLEEGEAKILEGSSLSKELKKSPLIPALMSRMVALGEEGGKVEEMLLKVADIYEENSEKSLLRFMTLLQPLILILIGCMVAMIMLAVLLPLTDINSFL